MKCASPYFRVPTDWPCQKCLPCRINKQRLWTIRLVLEAGSHPASSFVTLTYDPEHYPADGSVSLRAAQLFLKRLRRSVGPFRYFIVGEYGDRTFRAHYHAALFGVRDGYGVQDAWGQGHIHSSGLGIESARYLAGYVCKKMTKKTDARLQGRAPEFARMSKRPGLAAWAADKIGQFYTSKAGVLALIKHGISTKVVRQGGTFWPIGRYLNARVLAEAGISKEYVQHLNALAELEMRVLGTYDIEERKVVAAVSGQKAQARLSISQSRKDSRRETI